MHCTTNDKYPEEFFKINPMNKSVRLPIQHTDGNDDTT